METVARIEDPEQQKRLMTIILDDVQRLDRLISDISDASRLDAELSRADTETLDVGVVLKALMEVHQATVEEGGPTFEIDIAGHQDLAVQGDRGALGSGLSQPLEQCHHLQPAWRQDSDQSVP